MWLSWHRICERVLFCIRKPGPWKTLFLSEFSRALHWWTAPDYSTLETKISRIKLPGNCLLCAQPLEASPLLGIVSRPRLAHPLVTQSDNYKVLNLGLNPNSRCSHLMLGNWENIAQEHGFPDSMCRNVSHFYTNICIQKRKLLCQVLICPRQIVSCFGNHCAQLIRVEMVLFILCKGNWPAQWERLSNISVELKLRL